MGNKKEEKNDDDNNDYSCNKNDENKWLNRI